MELKKLNQYFLILILTSFIIPLSSMLQYPIWGTVFIAESFITELFWFATIFAFCNNNELSYKSIFTFKKVKCYNIFAAILCGIILTIVSIITNFIYIKLNIHFSHGSLMEYPSSYVFSNTVAVIILAPIIEEILFRGLFYNLLSKYKGSLIGIVISTLYFIFLHIRLSNVVSVILLGVCAALFFEVTHSLIPGVIMHAINNTVLTFLSKKYLINIDIGLLSLIILMLLCIAVLFLLCNKVAYTNSQKSFYEVVIEKGSQDKAQKMIDEYFIATLFIWIFLTLLTL